MGFFDLLNHLFNLLLPALWMATLLLLWHRLLARRHAITLGWRQQWLRLFVAGVLVLLVGLVLQGDGAMTTYIALAVVTGAYQAWLLRRYRPALPSLDPAATVTQYPDPR
ncbi:hypothetical protein WGP40_09805 [Brachymonas sp. G13]|uniref:hypothetical protein n=1 Tax=Brachymonas wangyanguii TaxID=3130163 RepID=UPI00307EC615